jgi:hypothetical protein
MVVLAMLLVSSAVMTPPGGGSLPMALEITCTRKKQRKATKRPATAFQLCSNAGLHACKRAVAMWSFATRQPAHNSCRAL